jgi:hypothetical protein
MRRAFSVGLAAATRTSAGTVGVDVPAGDEMMSGEETGILNLSRQEGKK